MHDLDNPDRLSATKNLHFRRPPPSTGVMPAVWISSKSVYTPKMPKNKRFLERDLSMEKAADYVSCCRVGLGR